MKKLMTKQFAKWASKQKIPKYELASALSEVQAGIYEASLGGHIYKKRIRFEGQGKSGSGRTIVCYKRSDITIFIHGFAKNDKDNLSSRELHTFKEFAKILLGLSQDGIATAIENGDFIEVKS